MNEHCETLSIPQKPKLGIFVVWIISTMGTNGYRYV